MKRLTCASGNRESGRPLARLKCSRLLIFHTMHLLTRRHRKFPPPENKIARDESCTKVSFLLSSTINNARSNELRVYEGWLHLSDTRAKTLVVCHENLIRSKFDDSLLELPAIMRSVFSAIKREKNAFPRLIPPSLMSRIERKYCLISTSYLTELFEIFILLYIWQNCVYYSTCGVTPILGKEPGCTNVLKEKCLLDWLRSTTQINKLPRIRLGNTPIVQWISRSTGMRADADSNLVRDKAFSLILETCIESHLQFI